MNNHHYAKTNHFSNNSPIHEFISAFPSPEQVNKLSWELLIAAMGSEHADMWSKEERANMMLFVELAQQALHEIYEPVEDFV
ncbi:hypothetical protein [Chitinophaga lutea]|nr:hypothetical protein [Chitinophaga lutea]